MGGIVAALWLLCALVVLVGVIWVIWVIWRGDRDILSEAAEGNMAQVKAMLARRPELLNTPGFDGNTPLHMAVWHGNTQIAAYLIEKGADIGARTDLGKTPLSIALENDYGEIASLLREKGAEE